MFYNFEVDKFYALFVLLDVRWKIERLEEGGAVVIDGNFNIFGFREECP